MISISTRYLDAPDPSLPGLALQITKMVDSYMIWVGTTTAQDTVDQAAMQGSLGNDWACAMPARISGIEPPATLLSRSSSSDVALSMAQRLAKRFQRQIFLSVDIPVSPMSMGMESRLVAVAEKGIVENLKELEGRV